MQPSLLETNGTDIAFGRPNYCTGFFTSEFEAGSYLHPWSSMHNKTLNVSLAHVYILPFNMPQVDLFIDLFAQNKTEKSHAVHVAAHSPSLGGRTPDDKWRREDGQRRYDNTTACGGAAH